MSARVRFWALGLLAVTLASWLMPWNASWREVGPLGLALGLVVAGGLFEFRTMLSSLPASRTLRDTRPPDGRVGLAVIRGVRSDPNPCDPPFRRFVGRESTGTDNQPAKIDPRQGVRSAPPLLGRVVLISVFLGRDGKGWTDAEIAQAHEAMRRAGAWIEREASAWHAPVNVDLAETYFVADDEAPEDVEVKFAPRGEEVQPIEGQATVKALTALSRAAARLGFRDAVDLIAWANPRVEADARVWLLHPRRAGCSLAIPLDQTELKGVSLAVCYAREANFPEPLTKPPRVDPVTIAHEVLHLFGAEDKYGLPLRAFPDGTVGSRDIMRLNEMPLARYRIDPLTAREIGWAEGTGGFRSTAGKAKPPPRP